MADTPERTASTSGVRPPGSPEGKVVGAVNPSQAEAVRAALVAAGFPADQIDVVTSADVAEMDAPIDRPGLSGLVSRFLFSMGDDLEEIEQARQELAAGQILIGVRVQGHEGVHQAADVLRSHGSHWIRHFGRWTITSLG